MTPLDTSTTWEQGWKGHEEQQLRRLASLSLAEKLEWLEQAHRLVHHLSRTTTTARSTDSAALE